MNIIVAFPTSKEIPDQNVSLNCYLLYRPVSSWTFSLPKLNDQMNYFSKTFFFFPVLLVWFPLTLPLNDPYTAWFQSGCCASVPHSLSTQKVLAVKSEMENSQRWFIQVMMKHGADESLVYSTVLSCDIIAVLLTHWLFLTDLTQLQRVAFFF